MLREVALTVLTVPEMAARLRISRYGLYARIERRAVPAFRALYDSGPFRVLLGPGDIPRPLPHFGRREGWVS